MSEYYLADRLAAERAKQRAVEKKKPAEKAVEFKGSLLGDFLSTITEPTGSDPYNSAQGKAERDLWKTRSQRR